MKQIRPPLNYLKDNIVIIDTSHLLSVCVIFDYSGPRNERHTLYIWLLWEKPSFPPFLSGQEHRASHGFHRRAGVRLF